MQDPRLKPIPEIVDDLPNISGSESHVEDVSRDDRPVFLERTPFNLQRVQSAFALGLHMHQPLILQDGDVHTAPMIGNLQYMIERRHVHGMHDAPAFAWCYSRTADFIRDLVDAGCRPRVMLDYSGELLFGLRQMGRGDILDNLMTVVHDDRYWPCVEWLGTMWGHAVVPSTPVPDIKLHIQAWRHNFAAIFGWEALRRVRGFSPPEMHLPNHPDVCYEYLNALRESGYRWLLVQEHSAEELDGHGLRERYLPRRLVARNSHGQEASLTALIKTQGSDSKLVAQMQPLAEARNERPHALNGRHFPPLVLQISDGENGGVMMNEFPDNYKASWYRLGTEGVVGINGTEYLELLHKEGLTDNDFPPIQPLHQHVIWQQAGGHATPERVQRAIEEAKRRDHRFNMDGGSWTNNLSWVDGYENVLDPMNKLSALFHDKVDSTKLHKGSYAYRNALYHNLVAQTSCYRYWGQSRWTDYAREICRRGTEILTYDF